MKSQTIRDTSPWAISSNRIVFPVYKSWLYRWMDIGSLLATGMQYFQQYDCCFEYIIKIQIPIPTIRNWLKYWLNPWLQLFSAKIKTRSNEISVHFSSFFSVDNTFIIRRLFWELYVKIAACNERGNKVKHTVLLYVIETTQNVMNLMMTFMARKKDVNIVFCEEACVSDAFMRRAKKKINLNLLKLNFNN